jgi:hypothetical protein
MLATLNQAQQHLFGDKKKTDEEKPVEPQDTAQAKPDEPGKQDA